MSLITAGARLGPPSPVNRFNSSLASSLARQTSDSPGSHQFGGAIDVPTQAKLPLRMAAERVQLPKSMPVWDALLEWTRQNFEVEENPQEGEEPSKSK